MRTVLIADDHEDTVDVTAGYLSLYGYDAFGAYSGPEALKLAFERDPDSIILDIALPNMDGFDVARTLRQSGKFNDTVIIAYSGYGGTEYYNRAKTVGFDFYLLKPAEPEILLACLDAENYPAIVAQSV